MPFKNPDERTSYQSRYDTRRKKTHRAIKVTLALEQYQQFERFAKLEKQSIPKTVLALADAKAGDAPFVTNDTKEKLTEVVYLLRASGNNVNQIAHACNMQVGFAGDGKTPQEGVEILSRIHEGLRQIEEVVKTKLKGEGR